MDKNKILEDFKEYLESMDDNEFFEVMKEKYEAKFEEESEDKKQITMDYDSYLQLQQKIDAQNEEIQRYKKAYESAEFQASIYKTGIDMYANELDAKQSVIDDLSEDSEKYRKSFSFKIRKFINKLTNLQ